MKGTNLAVSSADLLVRHFRWAIPCRPTSRHGRAFLQPKLPEQGRQPKLGPTWATTA